MIGATLYFWSRSTNNLHLLCGMVDPTLFDPTKKYKINWKSSSYRKFIKNNMGQGNNPVSDDEHIAFLCFWLNVVIFCSRSNFYNELGQIVISPHNQTPLSAGGPLWLLQLWLNTIFEKLWKSMASQSQPTTIKGIQLSALKPTFSGSKIRDLFWAVFTKFYHATFFFQNEDLNFAPFVDRKCGPTWF
ncbi:hypothetical protein AHAS_Ahas05G0069500 [Arachis hypogaea]